MIRSMHWYLTGCVSQRAEVGTKFDYREYDGQLPVFHLAGYELPIWPNENRDNGLLPQSAAGPRGNMPRLVPETMRRS